MEPRLITPAEILRAIRVEREAEEKAAVAERNLNLDYEMKKRKIELELWATKVIAYPDNVLYQQRKLETELRLAVLLETLNQIEKSKAKGDEQRQFPLTGGC